VIEVLSTLIKNDLLCLLKASLLSWYFQIICYSGKDHVHFELVQYNGNKLLVKLRKMG